MKTTLLSFADAHYKPAQDRLGQTAKPWFDYLRLKGEESISGDFRRLHGRLLSFPRGYGFWVWKPYLILSELMEMKSGDVLMYCDSQIMFVDDPSPLFKLCLEQDGVLLFDQRREGHKNKTWTRRDCFIKMGCDELKYWNGIQLNSATMLWSPTRKAFAFLKEWFEWVSDEQVASDAECVLGKNFPEFKDHRHDQSILSLMAIRDDLMTFPDPTQYGNGYLEKLRGYGQILQNDRMVSALYPIPCREPMKAKSLDPDEDPCAGRGHPLW